MEYLKEYRPKIMILVGPPGSGKSTDALSWEDSDFVRISQDDQGPSHLAEFNLAIAERRNIVVDRMNFNKAQRARYLEPAKKAGYATAITVFHQPREVCLARMEARKNHPTIKDMQTAKKALNFFFCQYERPDDSEAESVYRVFPEGDKPKVIYSDLDGTTCDVAHRRHFVQREGKKDWPSFFENLVHDTPVQPVKDVLEALSSKFPIVYCSGRSEDYREPSETWLKKYGFPEGVLYMRPSKDSRKDDIVKEILLDFEILTRFSIHFCLDDRDQVVRMLRKRGQVVFQVADGNF